MPKPKHILVIRFSAMGDVAMMVPVLRTFANQNPDVKITVVTRPFFKPIFNGIPNVQVYTADLKGTHKGIIGLYKLSRALRKIGFDAIADLHNVLRTKILKVFFIGKKVIQIDKGRKEKKDLVTGKSVHQLKTTHQRYADVFRILGFELDLSRPLFSERFELSEELKILLAKSNTPVIGIAPFAAHSSKMYPLHLMEKVISELNKSYRILLFGGGKEETSLLNNMASKYENVDSVAGVLSFDDELKLISNLDVMLSMDSGNSHLAAMFGIKVITIWGVTHPYAGFAPFNQPQDYALLANRDEFTLIPTSIYGNSYPEGYENAAGSISVEEIVTKVTTVLKN
ncbi:glycosyltransferase family 9 protein [Winogradskyella poriferorum]|uniref:glycosyltransferase family 9 protein n=1 Tax=Winogradskyella poriferorum TaxID=307627 RepID=UPI003D65125E